MTKEALKQKLANRDSRDQFNFEVKEREAIMAEKPGEFKNTNEMAYKATVEAWLQKGGYE